MLKIDKITPVSIAVAGSLKRPYPWLFGYVMGPYEKYVRLLGTLRLLQTKNLKKMNIDFEESRLKKQFLS